MNTITDARFKQAFNLKDRASNKDRAIERTKMRCSYRHCVRLIEVFHPEASRAEIERRAKREWRRNLNMVKCNAVRFESSTDDRQLVAQLDVVLPVLSSRRPSGHAPRTSRRATRATTGSSTNDDGGSDSSPSDQAEPPSQPPLIGGFRNNNPRKENNSKEQRKQTIVELSNRLEFGSAALMFLALASLLAAGWSR